MRFQTTGPSAFMRAVHAELETSLADNVSWKLGGVDSLHAVHLQATEKIGDLRFSAQIWMERPRLGKAACKFEVATSSAPGEDAPAVFWRNEIAYSIRSFLKKRGLPAGVEPAAGSTTVKLKLSVPTIVTPADDEVEQVELHRDEIKRIVAFVAFLEHAMNEWAATADMGRGSGIEHDFHNLALQLYTEAMTAVGYPARRYRQKVRDVGGVAAAKFWLKPKSGDVAQAGLLELLNHDRLDISLEAKVIQEPWSSLFTDDELNIARARLARYGYFDAPDDTPRPDNSLSEEVETFIEGKTTTAVINVYERDPKARAACIKHYGAKCCICGFEFEESYGPDMAGFIHVHHLCSLASLKKEYEVDPIADLRPVCPNCHAVIHRRKHPLTLDAVRTLMRVASIEDHADRMSGPTVD